MPADYSKFKTPFVEVYVGDSKGKGLKRLPPQVEGLLEKVEFTETICCGSFNQITLTFLEGSREPYRVTNGSGADPDVYTNEGKTGSGLTNQSGFLVDLKFGTTSLAFSNILSEFGGAALNLLTSFLSAFGKDNSPPDPVLEFGEIGDPDNNHFLFQQRNQIQIRWGYKEDPDTVRTANAYVMMVTSEFPEKGTPRTTVVCHSAAASLDQIAAKQGAKLGVKVLAGYSESGFPMFDYQDVPLRATFTKFAAENGIKLIISPKFRAEIYEAGKTKLWLGGESFHQFLTRLASDHDAVYQFLTDSNGNDVIVFVDTEDWQKYPIILDESLFTYKGTDSLIKSLNIKADFGKDTGTFLQSISEEGGPKGIERISSSEVQLTDSVQQANSPIGPNSVAAAEAAAKFSPTGVTGRSEITAHSETKNQQDFATTRTNNKDSNLIALEFSSLGYTQLYPGTLKFSGIGDRYTGYYNIKQVTHTIDSNGYNCRGMAMSFTNAKGGVQSTNPEKPKIQEDKVGVGLFESAGLYKSTFINSSLLAGSVPEFGSDLADTSAQILGPSNNPTIG